MLLAVRTNILFKHAVASGLNMERYLFVIFVQKHNDFFGNLCNLKINGVRVLDSLINKIIEINPNADICISSESQRDDFNILHDVLFCQRGVKNQTLKDSLIETSSYVSSKLNTEYEYIVSLTVDYPLLDAHYILGAISYIHYFETSSVDSVCVEDSIIFKHNGDSLTHAYNGSTLRLERDTLYKKSGGLSIIRVDKLEEYDGISTQKSGHILIDKLSALRADNIEVINFIKGRWLT